MSHTVLLRKIGSRDPVLSVVALNGPVNRFFGRGAITNGIEGRRLTWAGCSAPVNKKAVWPAVRVESQHMIGQKSPAPGIRGHAAPFTESSYHTFHLQP